MPDRDGATCPTCLTLNPPAAPACVRCNTPLPAAGVAGPAGGVADPMVGSKRIGPGLGESARGAPNSSRARAATVQPPGYGVEDPEPVPPAPAPEPDTALARRVTLAGLAVVAAVVVVGGGAMWLSRPDYVDSRDLEARVGAELTERGGAPVTVSCPGDPRRRTGETFGCVATDTAGGRRTLTVTVLDDAGHYRWALT